MSQRLNALFERVAGRETAAVVARDAEGDAATDLEANAPHHQSSGGTRAEAAGERNVRKTIDSYLLFLALLSFVLLWC